MATQVQKFLKLLSEKLECTQVIDNTILIFPTSAIARGVRLERTSQKNVYYIWRFVFPLYCPLIKVIPLTYSKRFSLDGEGDTVIAIDGDLNVLAEMISRKLKGHFDYREILARVDVEDFFQICRPSREFLSPVRALTLSMSDYIVGEVARARQLLLNLLAQEKPFFYLEEATELASRMVIWFDSDRSAMDLYIELCKQKNIELFFSGLIMEE